MDTNPPGAGRVARACPLCGEAAGLPILEKGTLRLVRCRRCAMIYANPVDGALASGQFYDRLGVPFYLSADKLESDYSPARFERELRLFRRHCRGGAVLDVGCSTGGFLFQLKNRWPGAYTVTGMDVAGAALDHAESRGMEVIREPFVPFAFGARNFDAVTFWAVLEHVLDPVGFVRKAAAILKPGGHCFVLVPNMRSLAVRLLGSKYRYVMPDHVNYFTADALKRLARQAPAFDILKVGFSHFNPLVILKDLSSPRVRVSEEERARLLKRTTACKRNPLLKPVKWAYSGVEKTLGLLGLADNVFMVLRKVPEN